MSSSVSIHSALCVRVCLCVILAKLGIDRYNNIICE